MLAANDDLVRLSFNDLLALKEIDSDAPIVTADTYSRRIFGHNIRWKKEPLPEQYNQNDEPVLMRGAWWAMVKHHTGEHNWSGSFSSFSQSVVDRFIRFHKLTLITTEDFEKAEDTISALMLQGNRHKRSAYRRAKTPIYLPPPKKIDGRAHIFVKGKEFCVSFERYRMMCALRSKERRLASLESRIKQIQEQLLCQK